MRECCRSVPASCFAPPCPCRFNSVKRIDPSKQRREGQSMSTFPFTRNDYPTIGVEVELQLVDAETMGLTSAIEDVRKLIPPEYQERIKPELMQSYLEINTGICR